MRAQNGDPEYITLREALQRGAFSVTEVSEGGSVLELMVVNKGDAAVLLLDGEELRGAKQNRILNTTILVGPKSSTKVPVSCVEHGRWSYQSKQFAESGNVMHREMRALNVRQVNVSLERERAFRSDQGLIWDKVAEMACVLGAPSRTGAMRDVYEAKGADLDGYLKSFRPADVQKGILVFGRRAKTPPGHRCVLSRCTHRRRPNRRYPLQSSFGRWTARSCRGIGRCLCPVTSFGWYPHRVGQ